MSKTIVGLFDEYREAQRAVVELVENGISREDIGITSRDYTNYDEADTRRDDSYRDDEGVGDKIGNFFSRLFGDDDEYASHYTEAVGRGGTVVTVDCESDEQADRAEGGEARIPVIEEELRVGKREVEGGGVRVRTRVVERPVEEAVRLREERVNVERRPVNRPVSESDLSAFREGTFELRERSEEAVVDKTARVVEEVAINKEVA